MLLRSNAGFTIGALARAAGVHVETIRYYQRLRLISKPPRRFGAVHHYSDDALARLRFIKRAQNLGFSLREVAVLVGLSSHGSCGDVRELVARKLATVEKELRELEARCTALRGLLAECDTVASAPGCPALQSLYSADADSLTP